jgi:rod shape determining protein RodA
LLYGVLAWRFWRVARLAKDSLGTLIAAGALAALVWHVFENVGMTMGLTPVTGIPLPLVSYGGSSVLAFLCLIGLVQSVHMRRFT